MNACDPREQQSRQHILEAAYVIDGRYKPHHAFHGLYTGLSTTTAYECASNANPNNRRPASRVVA